jgi:hypothetical protein
MPAPRQILPNDIFGTATVSSVASNPVVETGYAINIGGAASNAAYRVATTLEVTSMNPATDFPTTGYRNLIDHSRHYDWVESKIGHNESLSTNDGRTQDSVYRVRLIKSGQGDGAAYNFSVFVTAPQRPGVTHWLANAAGIGINGTVVIAADGAYANPRETVITDKPNTIAYYGTGYNDVARIRRNAGNRPKASGGIGEIQGAYRALSEGPEPVDNILSATGKWHVGVDLTMASADFTDGNAVALKKEDGIVFDGSAAEQDDAEHFLRADGRMTSGGRYKIRFTGDSGTDRLQFLADNLQALALRRDVTLGAIASVENLFVNQDVYMAAGKHLRINGKQLFGERQPGWGFPTATLSRAALSDASDLAAVRSTLAALITDLYYTTGVYTLGHGAIGLS